MKYQDAEVGAFVYRVHANNQEVVEGRVMPSGGDNSLCAVIRDSLCPESLDAWWPSPEAAIQWAQEELVKLYAETTRKEVTDGFHRPEARGSAWTYGNPEKPLDGTQRIWFEDHLLRT